MIKRDPLVSICLITYNHEKYIQQAVDTILKQHMDFLFELLIADDASTDRTQEILKNKYSNIDNVRLILRKKNSEGRNGYLTVQEARGKYIYMCEGDDYWIGEDGLQTLVDWIETHKEYVGVCGRRITLSEKTGLMLRNYDMKMNNKEICMDDYLENKATPDLCSMLYKNFYRDGKYNYKSYLISRNVGDLTRMIYILLHGKIFQLDKLVGVYRSDRFRKAGSYNAKTSSRKIFEEHLSILSNLPRLFSEKMDFSKMRKRYVNWYIPSIPSTYEFIKQMPYLINKIGVKMTIESLICRLKEMWT